MRLARELAERPAGVRYHVARLRMPLLRPAFAHIGEGAVVIRPEMLQGVDRISIGDYVLIRDGAWLAAEGAAASVAIGNECYIGHRFHVHSIDPVSIGAGCVIADNVMVSSSDHDHSGDRHGVHGTGPVVIEDHVFLGQNVVVLGGVHIGRGATVAAGAVVVKDVEAGAVVGGVPAKVLRGDRG